MMGLDPGYTGMIYDTASVSSMHAIAAAREGTELRIREEGMRGRNDLPLLRVYVSEQSHSSIEKSVITLGLGQRGLRKIPTDVEFRMDPVALAAAIKDDQRNGIVPFCMVATVGTTSTSSIDPVPAIVPICEQHAIWLHVDAAYAGSAAVVPELRHILAGCEGADSVAVNPHKWLFTPSTSLCSIADTWISCDVLSRWYRNICELRNRKKCGVGRIMAFSSAGASGR